jgi:triosephosphate isomerase
MVRRFFVGGNFKLNPPSLASSESLVDVLNNADLDPETGKAQLLYFHVYFRLNISPKKEVVIAPPSIYLIQVNAAVRNGVKVSAQNCYFEHSGAFTGEIRHVRYLPSSSLLIDSSAVRRN